MAKRGGREAPATPRSAKTKVSFTIDESVLEEVRAMAAGRPLSGVVNELLARALAQSRLSQLVDEMKAEAGTAPSEVYEQILEEWDRGAKR